MAQPGSREPSHLRVAPQGTEEQAAERALSWRCCMSLTALAGACLPSCAVLAGRLECAPEGEAPGTSVFISLSCVTIGGVWRVHSTPAALHTWSRAAAQGAQQRDTGQAFGRLRPGPQVSVQATRPCPRVRGCWPLQS